MKNSGQGKREIAEIQVGRLFFAIWPEIHVAGEVYALGKQQQREAGGRLMRSDTLHMTLVFLGNQPLDRLPALYAAAGQIDAECFDLRLDRIAGWRSNRLCYAEPSVAPQPLLTLAKQIRDYVSAAGFSFDGKPFKPHVTLLRGVQPCLKKRLSSPSNGPPKNSY